MDELNQLSSQIIKAAMTVHKELGPGLLESVYHVCMLIELERMGIECESEVLLPVIYRGRKLDGQEFRLDLLIDDVRGSIEAIQKELGKLDPYRHGNLREGWTNLAKQLLTYLRLANKPLGLLINFNEALLKNGITRIINTPRT